MSHGTPDNLQHELWLACVERLAQDMPEQQFNTWIRPLTARVADVMSRGPKTIHPEALAVEAAECPTLLNNGFGEHNIQGIGDKHVPFIHNVMNTDFVVAISDLHTDALVTLFNTDVGRKYLIEKSGHCTIKPFIRQA